MSERTYEMTQAEIDQFLAFARVGRLGLTLHDGPYVVPLGYAYANGRISFHTCRFGKKMKMLEQNPRVCFEVDEALSDTSMYKSVIIFGSAEIINDPDAMIPHLQLLINKYRVPELFDAYMNRPGRNREKELAAVRICVIIPTQMTGRKMVRQFHPDL